MRAIIEPFHNPARPAHRILFGGLALFLATLPAQAQQNSPAVALPSNIQTFEKKLEIPTLNSFSIPDAPAQNAAPAPGQLKPVDNLELMARLDDKGGDIASGLVWRVFSPISGPDGQLPLVASAKGGKVSLNLEPGDYLVHVAYGRAGATKRIVLKDTPRHEVMILDAGGIKLNAVLPDDKPINEKLLRFSIFSGDGNNNERSLIVPDVKPNAIIRLNSGTYHVISNYGNDNAVIRADIRVDAGKLTEAIVQHRAAEVTLKLVREQGGEALADTSWSILNASGDSVKETVGAYSSMVLIEGDYVAVAKNKDHIYQQDFKVTSGEKAEIEVTASKENETNEDAVD